ncbi:uncharacterized protein TrAtP1_010931 [Trichoderma atroviride]|uniref:uncharacterized protein n=1 Tax=Hypocrea atroviridis TaxID=63577 RepID=UPI0033252588|nr:hypothetical protein TrAtP1_010931 [Trichoderma atroviride]
MFDLRPHMSCAGGECVLSQPVRTVNGVAALVRKAAHGLPENGPACHRLAGAPVAAGASTGLGASPGTLGALSASGIAHKVARAH